MAHRPNKFTFPSASTPTNGVPLVPMVTYGNAVTGPQPTQQELTQHGHVNGHYSMYDVNGSAEPQPRNPGGHSMNFSGPVHVHVDNMYVYDGEQLRRAIQMTQRANMLDNGTLAQPGQQTAAPKAPRKRAPPKKKTSVGDTVPETNTNGGDGSATPPHSD